MVEVHSRKVNLPIIEQYLHFQSKPLMSMTVIQKLIFITVHNLMKDIYIYIYI